MPLNAASYIERQADAALLEQLRQGHLCYVLNARQMGKSSLMVRCARRLQDAGHQTAILDLTAVGQSVTPEQWYYGLLNLLGQQTDNEDAFDDFWFDNEALGPMQRFFAALRQIALPALLPNQRLVLFVDEIDAVRSIAAFNTDEFFAGIRQCFVGRATESPLQSLTFCLLGTATPAELIKDARITPFNIGKRIELRDFTSSEAAPLIGKHPRILFWTGGHPYLTQRIAALISDMPHATEKDVDALVSRLFLAHGMRETDDNLSLVSSRLLLADADRFALLSLYRQVLRGSRVPDDETNVLCSILKLSGVVRVEIGCLIVRNEIYHHVFDDAWVEKHLPGVEVRRQKAAFVRGLSIAGAIAGFVLCIIGWLAYVATQETKRANAQTAVATQKAVSEAEQRRRADAQTALANDNAYRADTKTREATDALVEARKQRKLADKKAKEAADNLALANRRLAEANAARTAEGVAKNEAIKRAEEAQRSAEEAKRSAEIAKAKTTEAERTSYTANMNLIQSKWDENNVGRVLELLGETKNYKDRGFEWGYWNRLCHLDQKTLKGSGSILALSPDGRRMVTHAEIICDVSTGRQLLPLKGHGMGGISTAAFSPEGRRVVTGGFDNSAKVWDAVTGKELITLRHTDVVRSVMFSPDGRLIATRSDDRINVWDAVSGKDLWKFPVRALGECSVTFSPDSKLIITGIDDGTARVWDAVSGSERLVLRVPEHDVFVAMFSPDGKRIVTGGDHGTVRVWDAASGAELLVLKGHDDSVILSAAFSLDGKRMVTGSSNHTATIWDAVSGKELLRLKGHADVVRFAAFSPDSIHVVTGSDDGTIKFWDTALSNDTLTHEEPSHNVLSVVLSPDGNRIATGGPDGIARIRNVISSKHLLMLDGHHDAVDSLGFSSDGKRIVTGHSGVARVWDVATGKQLLTLDAGIGNVQAVAFSPDGNTIITGRRQAINVWDSVSGKELLELKNNSFGGVSIAVSPNGRRIAKSSLDMVTVLDSVRGKELLLLEGKQGNILSVAFSPNGRQIVTTGTDQTAKVWDLSGGKELLTLKGHSSAVFSAAFSPDGTRIVTGSADNTAKVWDTSSGKELLTLKGHTDVVRSVTFSPDGKRIITGSGDGTAKVWFSDIEDANRVFAARSKNTVP